jgi:redox-sensing transcriptional repressor
MSLRGELPAPHGDQAVPKATVGRLSLYLRQLEQFFRDGTKTVSSRRLGDALGISDAQVRKDLGYFGPFGQSGIGYDVDGLIQTIRKILGTHRGWPVALVGIGNLGRALVGYRGFRRQGFQIQAIFDADPAKQGQTIEGICVESVDELPRRIAEQKVTMAMIAVPADAAQSVADRLVAAGVQGILNFAPVPLVVPDGVSVVSVDLAIQLEGLSYQVQNDRPLDDAAPAV